MASNDVTSQLGSSTPRVYRLGVDPKTGLWVMAQEHVVSSEWQAAVFGAVGVFFTIHASNHGGDLKSAIASVWSICKKSANRLSPSYNIQDDQRKTQVEAALWDVRARYYRQSVQFLIHLSALAVLGQLYAAYQDPSLQQLVQLMFGSGVYAFQHFVRIEKLKLSANNLRTIYVIFYASFVPFVLANPGNGRAIITQGFNACSRMIMSVIFIDTLTAAPAQLMISLVETGVYAMDGTDTMLFAWMQSLVGSSIIGFSAVLEYWVTSHISMLLDTESMVLSFRRMLRGVSDGEVLLNQDMHVCEDADCLKHLLMTQGNFKGKHFERLLVPEETGRFQDFLKQSMAEVRKPEGERTKTPPCLRISLRGASDIRVGVDLWHVLMPGRKDGMLHMLVLREDTEARAAHATLPAACTNEMLPMHSSTASTRASDSDSESSMSQKSSTSFLQDFPELVDMTLCVDATTHWFDIEQAHLSFQRQAQSSDSSMPSLRRLVRPTDWETVRSKLKQVMTSGAGLSDLRLRLVDDAKRSMIGQAQVSMYKAPRGPDGMKLCVQLTEVVFEDKNSRDWSLAAINE